MHAKRKTPSETAQTTSTTFVKMDASKKAGSTRFAARLKAQPLPTHGVQSSDLIDEHGDIADPTEYVARRLAGKIDFVFSVLLPAAYVVIICVLLRPFDEHEGVFQDDWKCTSISHVHDGDRVWHARC